MNLLKASIISQFMICIFFLAIASSVAASVSISSVTFISMDSLIPIALYDAMEGSETPTLIALPHFVASSGNTIPAVFRRNQSIRALIEIESTDTVEETLVISGRSSLINFDETEIIFSKGNKVEVVLNSEGNLPDAVGKFDTKIKWEIKTVNGETIASDFSKSSFLTTLKKPITGEALFLELVEFSCTEAAGLTDEKQICDALISNLHKTEMHYGGNGWSTFDILKNRGGMCGGWCRVFQDLCGTQGIKMGAWFFTLRNHQNHKYEKKWTAIDIHDGGLNNDEPPWTEKVAFANEVYPEARYFSNESPDDDIEFDRNRPLFRFSTVSDGHCVNFLNYNGDQYMYDPSFGKGSFGGFFSGVIPQDENMNTEQLKVFRKVYFDKGVDHLHGRLLCIRKDGKLKKMIMSPLTAIIPDHDIQLYWQCLDTPENDTESSDNKDARKVSSFKKLFSVSNEDTIDDEAIDFLSTLQTVQESSLDQAKDNMSLLLSRSKPLKLRTGSQLPGILPPLQTLQRTLILRARELKNTSLNIEIDLLKNRSEGTFKRLIRDL